MVSMAAFGGDAFQGAAMIEGLEKRTYIPDGLDEIMGFKPVPVNKDVVYIGQKTRTNNVIRTTQRGAPIEIRQKPTKNYRPIAIPRIATGATLYAHEVTDYEPLDDETEEDVAAVLIAEAQEDLIGDVELTEERMRLGALDGTVLDEDNSVIIDYHDEFGIVPPADVDIDIDNASLSIGEIREKIGTQLITPINRAAGTGTSSKIQMRAICGDDFWYKLTGHDSIAKTYEGYAAASALRDDMTWERFTFAGVTWFHYRGTDDGSSIAIADDEAKIFPFGLKGMFQHVMGPFQETLSPELKRSYSRGRRYFPFLERDKSEKQQWVQPEIYAYPLFVNARPDLVLTATY